MNISIIKNLNLDAAFAGIRGSPKRLICLFQWEDMRDEFIQIDKSSSDEINACRPCVFVHLEDLSVIYKVDCQWRKAL